MAGFFGLAAAGAVDHDSFVAMVSERTQDLRDATAAASELTKNDFTKGGARLKGKVRRYRPRIVAVLGVGAYREAFARSKAVIGEQSERISEARVWVLPNPSGLNANYQLNDLVKLFEELQRAAGM